MDTSPTSKRTKIHFNEINKRNNPINEFIKPRALPLKQLKDLINDIYVQKNKYDERCIKTKQPKETMEQYMYTYLNQRYGLKSLIIEWANVIVSGIGKYAKGDSDIALFVKLLQNKCDAAYRIVHQEVKATMTNILSSKTNTYQLCMQGHLLDRA